MITENDKRKDKFIKMNHEEFNTCVAFALRNGERKVAYSQVKNGVFQGGMADTFEDALEWCRYFYNNDKSVDLTIGDFREGETIWTTIDILHEIGIVSDEEYDEYLDSIDLED